jgi:hypothetical protein
MRQDPNHAFILGTRVLMVVNKNNTESKSINQCMPCQPVANLTCIQSFIPLPGLFKNYNTIFPKTSKILAQVYLLYEHKSPVMNSNIYHNHEY